MPWRGADWPPAPDGVCGEMRIEEAARQPGSITFHLTPQTVWSAHEGMTEYRPEAFAREGFVHCTNGEELLIEVGNRYYRDDPRAYVVLEIETGALRSAPIYEDEEQRYPHVYGPIDRHAVRRVRRVERNRDGTFLGLGAVVDDTAP
jgi:uncharacterized protein (DUF952 family)